jgi:hypothetical protein
VDGIVIRSGQATGFAQVSWNMCGSIVIKEKYFKELAEPEIQGQI